MRADCVVDASVGVKLFVNEEGSELADRLFARLTAQPAPQFYVPDLFYVECANILWKYVRRFGYSPANARQDVADLGALALVTISTADLLEPALNLALTHDITAYNASYVALAQQLNLPLITADALLAHKLAGSGIIIKTLAELKDSV
ncbi:MAG: twitching motility protein PilT [Anaerolineae bacterium]|nr:type II toxin-antitoxin system VapC family toxin [Anaerolineales bacterium]MCQ3980118.1 twitching motility protein PilT [Anaerolineae bacterium]